MNAQFGLVAGEKTMKDQHSPVTLADALPKEMERVREVLALYRQIGPAGMFGAAMIEQDLRNADRAVMSGDVVAMLRSLKALQAIEA